MEVAQCRSRGVLLVHCTDHPGVDLADLLDLNAVAPEDLRPGMRIRIPFRERPGPHPEKRPLAPPDCASCGRRSLGSPRVGLSG